MSLIDCPECGKKISEKAIQCPYCGCPKSEWENINEVKPKSKNSEQQNVIDEILENNKYDWIKASKEIQKITGMTIKEAGSISMEYHKKLITAEADNKMKMENLDLPADNVIIKCKLDKELHFNGNSINIIDYGKTIYSGDITNIKVIFCEAPERFSSGAMRLSFPKEKPGLLFSNDTINLNFINSDAYNTVLLYLKENMIQYEKHQQYIRESCRQREEQKEIKTEEKKRLKNIAHCPKCNSTNLQYLGEDNIGGREAKTKTVTSLNLNPLKPFTLFNQKEKVVKKARAGFDLDRWRCTDCGKVFTTMKY